MNFTAPTADQLLAIRVNAGIVDLAECERFKVFSPDLVAAIVEGIGQFAAAEFAPLNRKGDIEGAKMASGKVCLPQGFDEAYRAYVDAGWNAVSAPALHGGQGLPFWRHFKVCAPDNDLPDIMRTPATLRA